MRVIFKVHLLQSCCQNFRFSFYGDHLLKKGLKGKNTASPLTVRHILPTSRGYNPLVYVTVFAHDGLHG
jgi:hypothetical protein